MVGVSALCRWTVSTLISKSLPFTKGMLGHNSGSKRGVYSMSWISGCIVAVKFFDRSLTSPVENMDQYDGSQKIFHSIQSWTYGIKSPRQCNGNPRNSILQS